MAINFPNNPGNGSQHTASGITWTYDGTTWKADGVTNSYVLPTASATVLGGIKVGSGLTINAGVLATTGGGGSQTLDQVLANGNTTTRDIDTTGKILFSNNYAQSGDLPSASTYHGMFAHVHAEGHGYFAHAGAWTQLLDTGSSIGELADVNLSSAPINGQVLKWDGVNNYWAPANDDTGGGGGGSQTLDDVLALNNVTTRDIDTTGKILFSNNYATTADLPSASTYHGMFAHVHGEGHGYYAHAGAWVQLLDTSSSINELADVTTGTISTGDVLTWSGSAWEASAPTGGGGGGSYTNSDVDTHLNTGSASSGQILSWNGSDYAWVADQTGGGGGGSGLQSRQTFNATTNSIADGAVDNITITAYKTYSLLKIQTSHAAWVTLYTDQTSRSGDTGRSEATDPLPGSGVVAEVITTAAQTQIITPATIGWNNESTPVASVYAKVVNKSGGTAAITVTITVVQLEG